MFDCTYRRRLSSFSDDECREVVAEIDDDETLEDVACAHRATEGVIARAYRRGVKLCYESSCRDLPIEAP